MGGTVIIDPPKDAVCVYAFCDVALLFSEEIASRSQSRARPFDCARKVINRWRIVVALKKRYTETLCEIG